MLSFRHLTLPLCGALAFTLVAGDAPKSAVPPAKVASKAKGAPVMSPLPAPVKVVAVEGITEYRLANGLRVLLFPDPSKATITTNITYLVGSRHEHYGETGMAHLLEHMVFKGTPTHPNVPPLLNELDSRRVQPELYPYGSRGPVGAHYLAAKYGVRWGDLADDAE